jgi:hypothetical protein
VKRVRSLLVGIAAAAVAVSVVFRTLLGEPQVPAPESASGVPEPAPSSPVVPEMASSRPGVPEETAPSRSWMPKRDRGAAAPTDLARVAELSIAAALIASALPGSLTVLRAPAALALILVLPGYALSAVIMEPSELQPAERLLLSLGLSIVVTILSALLLSLLGIRLTAIPWTALLAAITVGAAAVGLRHGRGRVLRRPRLLLIPAEFAALVCAALLLAGAAALGFSALAAPTGTQGTTGFGLAPAPHTADAVELDISSDRLHSTTYNVLLDVAGRPLEHFGPITLAPGASWTQVVHTPPGMPAVSARLYQPSAPNVVYRSVSLVAGWLGPDRGS